MKRALIHGTRICEIADADFPVAEGLTWVDVDDDTTTRDTYVDGAVVTYVEPSLTFAGLRVRRNALLDSTDWTQGSDSPLTDEVKTSWATYRQELRDLPANTDDPSNVAWPEAP